VTAMRATMLEVLQVDFVRTARAKGLSEAVVNLKHARRNALIPVTTLAGFTITGLLSGSVLTEALFAYPGIGGWGAKAAVQLDFAGVLGFALFTAVVVVLGNLAVDVMYAVIDPRVRFD
jgi:ABC-type dipeptide/oligopeptide/nickel transport system permease component